MRSRDSTPGSRRLPGLLFALLVCVGVLPRSALAGLCTGRIDVPSTPTPAALSAASDPEDAAANAWVATAFAVAPGERAVRVRARLRSSGEALAAECLGATGWRGQALALVRVARPAAGGRIDVEIDTELGAPLPLRSRRQDPEADRRTRELVRRHVANPEALPEPLATLAASPGAFRPSGDPSLDGSGVRYLVITTEALRASFEPLVNWKIARGVPAAIRTLEWIESRTRHGQDTAETLRNFLIEAYELWGIEWVLLGGDTGLVPTRYAWSQIYGGGTSPTDLYYACLDGTWNADGDSKWGEGELGFDPSEAELFPELTIGRAPVNNPQEAQIFVDRVIGYESPVYVDYQDRATFLAEILIPANWDSGQAYSYNGAVGTEQMVTQSVPAGMTVQRLYDTHWLYPGASKLTKSATLTAMNNGVGIVNQLGHGFRYTMSCGDASLVNTDADALANGDRSFVLVMANCAAASFDYNCLAERFLLNAGGGAAGVIGATRSVSAGLIVTYNRAIHNQLFQQGSVHLGQALDEARVERASFADLDGSDRWIQVCLTTLGDPEMIVWTGAVRPVDLVHPPVVGIGSATLEVEVQSAAIPVAGARVCAFKANEVFATGTSGPDGRVQLALEPETPGPLYLTVSGQNLASLTDTLLVPPSLGPVLTVTTVTLDDDAVGASDGDDNGFLDAGETIEITLDIANGGASAADSVTGLLTSPDPRFVVLQGQLVVGDLEPSAQQGGAGTLVVQVLPGVVDGTSVDLGLDLSDRAGLHYEETIHLQVCAPKPEPVRVQLESGTSTTVAVELKNYGSGGQPAVQVTFVDPAPDVTIVNGTANFPVIAAQATASAAPLLEFMDSTPGTLEPIEVRFEDVRGRSFTHVIDREPPPAPGSPIADLAAAAGTVHLFWPVSAAADHFGYHVFRRPHGSGAFERQTQDAIPHADYYDSNVEPSTQYDYYVVDVDASRQWSAPSAMRTVSTSAAALAGWPGEVLDPTTSSVAVGDLDGDGRPEVVLGDRGIYAWHANGIEVRNGDGDATTLGVFDPSPGTITASVALAAIDGAPGLEIVAASWATNRIDVKDGHGNSLHGWPRQPANGGNTGYWASPAVADLDGDGSAEIVAISKDGWLYAWHADGEPLLPQTNGAVRQVGIWTQTTPALADLDGDGHREMIVSGSSAQLFVVRDDGTDLPGFPVSFFALGRSSPAVGDVDGDGDLEIVVSSESDHLYVLQNDGTFLPGWPRLVPGDSPDLGPSPALGDLDGNGTLEIVICSVKSPFPNSKLFVFDAAGNTLLTKSLELNSQSSPILADIDGDGSIDIVHGGEAGVLHAWNLSGAELAGFPIALGDFLRGTPTYCDLDGDGGGDLVLAGWNRQLYAWRMEGPYRPDRAPWPTFHGDPARTGVLDRDFPTPTGEPPVPRRLAAVWAPNPFNPSVTVRFEVPASVAVNASGGAAAAAHVTVSVYDPRGRLVRTLLDAPRAAGLHHLVWDGKDSAGRPLGSGVYLYRVTAGSESVSGKLTLLR